MDHDSSWLMDSLDVDILVTNFHRMDLIRKVLTWIGIMNSLSLSFYLSLFLLIFDISEGLNTLS